MEFKILISTVCDFQDKDVDCFVVSNYFYENEIEVYNYGLETKKLQITMENTDVGVWKIKKLK